MSVISDKKLSWVEKFALNVLKCGKVPQHIAILMDGHRRYQRRTKTPFSGSQLLSHKKATEFYRWCLELGVPEVTLLACHKHNLQRSIAELSGISSYVAKAVKTSKVEEEITKHNLRFEICGPLTEFPKDLRQVTINMLEAGKNNDGMIIRAAFAYTSRDDITQSARHIVKGIEEGELKLEDISAGLIEKCLEIEGSHPVDLFIRMSGETLLSDFTTWTGSCAYLNFPPTLWPEYTIWDFFKAVFHYQRTESILTKVFEMEDNKLVENERVKKFIQEFHKKRNENIIESYNA